MPRKMYKETQNMVNRPDARVTTAPLGGISDSAHLSLSGPSALQTIAVSASPVSSAPFPKRPNRKNRRVKPPKDSKVYKAAIATLALRAQGLTYDEISEHLHLTRNTLQTYIKRANRKGWLNLNSFDDPDDQLEHILKSKVVKNLNAVLNETMAETENPESQPSDRAMEVSLEIAKGTGLLKQHQVVKNDNQTSLGIALKVQVDMPPPTVAPLQIRPGSVGGTPAFDAEIVQEPEET